MPKLQRQPYVFVIDDEDVIANSLAMILRLQGGFRARSFSSALDALKAARLEAPDLLISDVLMPDLSGIDLAIQVQEICSDCKVLLFSGQAATSPLLQAARESGYAFELLQKPVHPADLLTKIRDLTEPASPPPPVEELEWQRCLRIGAGVPLAKQIGINGPELEDSGLPDLAFGETPNDGAH